MKMLLKSGRATLVDYKKQGIVFSMKRVEVPATETESGEPLVWIVSNPTDMRRLRSGIAAYEATLRKLLGYGVPSDRDPDALVALQGRISETLTEVEAKGRSLPQAKNRVELSPEQADLVYIVAQTMVAQATETGNLAEALAREGTDHRPPYSWHETPLDAWQRFETALTPPTPQDSQP
jgi:hypothetical protein